MRWRNESIFDLVNLLLGLVLIASPWLFAFPAGAATQNAVIAGIVIGAVALMALVSFAQWEEWLNLILGLWVLISPWVLQFSDASAALTTHVIIGIAVMVLAALDLLTVHRSPPGITAS